MKKIKNKPVKNTLIKPVNDAEDQVKKFVEKALTMCLESTASISRATYPGVDL